MEATKLSLKLLIDKNGNKVLFAEAGKEVVDLLFNLLSLPLGTVIRLLSKKEMVGCLANLYESIEDLNETYIQPNQQKDSLLKPVLPISVGPVPLFLLNDEPATKFFYRCARGCSQNSGMPFGCTSAGNVSGYVSDDPSAVCPNCSQKMSSVMTYVAPPVANKGSVDEGGFVKGVVTYMVMDDLVVKPMSTISSITMLNKFNVKEIGALEEKVVDFGMDEGLKLLKASFQSKTVLSDVFLGIKRA
ncbi:hypothetical protein RJ640_030680 [Escallonia rubra]|uniref:DUF674 domain-containing protein n=1 Tax=Escallonia rubra TaxID=112253 RepID=A0AA88SE37_9ASTE|nr:hypothetical protein RJ640_030680 [Escallonia rubra]